MLQGLALKWTSTLIFIFIVGLVFYFVPNAKVRFKDVVAPSPRLSRGVRPVGGRCWPAR